MGIVVTIEVTKYGELYGIYVGLIWLYMVLICQYTLRLLIFEVIGWDLKVITSVRGATCPKEKKVIEIIGALPGCLGLW